MTNRLFLPALLTVMVLLGAEIAGAEDWPRWRGPRGDGTWNAPKLPEKWPAEGLKAKWKADIGAGFAGVVVADHRVMVMDRPKPSVKDQDPDGSERVLCFDAETGKQLWSHEYPAHYGKLDYGSGPRAAPTIFEDRVYTLGAVGHVYCLDAKNGKVLWSHDMVKEFGARISEWGFAASPLIVDNLVVVHTGAEPNGSLVAFDRNNGAEVWRSLPDPAGYCTPILIESPSGPQLVIWTPKNVHGVDPKSGKLNWTIPYEVTYGVAIATPIYQENLVFVTGYWEGSKAIRLGKTPTEAELAWEDTRNLRGLMAPPLYREGHVYSLDKQHGMTCFVLQTGKKLWDDDNTLTPKDRNPQLTMVWLNDGDRVLALNAEGELVLARFSPAGYEEQSRTKIIGRTWANPAFAGHCVYARNDTELVCVPLTAEPSAR